MRNLVVVLLMLAVALSGCSDGDTDPEPQDDGTQGTADEPTDGPESSSSVENKANTPPTANLTADAATGQAPLTVNFTVGGTDADGDALNWTLDADGDGTADANGSELPGTFSFSYPQAGNYSAAATVTDGNASTTARLNITVSAAPPVAPPRETTTHSCTATAGAAVISFSGGPVNIGGCNIVTLSTAKELLAQDPAEGCSIQVDLDGDTQADEPAQVGKVYDEGASFTAFCEVGTFEAENSITVADPL